MLLPFAKKWHCQKGIITLEMLIAMSLIIIAISSVILLVAGGQAAFISSQIHQEALYQAQALIEETLAQGRKNQNTPKACSDAACPGAHQAFYSRNLALTDIDSIRKTATGTVSWQGGNIALATIIAQWQSLDINTCLKQFTSTGNQPSFQNFATNAIAPDGDSNGLAVSDLKYYRQKLYVAAANSENSNGTFYIFDAGGDAGQPPSYLASLDNDPNTNPGPNAITLGTINGTTYAFLASPSSFSRGQLQVIDVSNPAQNNWQPPMATYKIPTEHVPAAGRGKSIFYRNTYVYLGLTAAAGGTEFNIIDVSDPLAPRRTGGYSLGGHDVNAIYVSGSYAYLAHPTDGQDSWQEQLTVLDISDPALPVRAGGFYTYGGSGGNGKSLAMNADTLYLGRTATDLSGSNDSLAELYALDISDPANPANQGWLPLAESGESNNAMIHADNRIFSMTNSYFNVINAENPQNMFIASSTSWPLISGIPDAAGAALHCSDENLYAAIAVPGEQPNDIISIITP